jgi:hypothetical protein
LDALPFSGENHAGWVNAVGAAPVESEIDVAGGDYLQAMGMRLLRGRWFLEEEMAETKDSAIVDESIAHRCGRERARSASAFASIARRKVRPIGSR